MAETKKMNITQKITQHIDDKGLKHSWIAKNLKISPAHFSYILRGERPLTDANKRKINKLLKTKF